MKCNTRDKFLVINTELTENCEQFIELSNSDQHTGVLFFFYLFYTNPHVQISIAPPR